MKDIGRWQNALKWPKYLMTFWTNLNNVIIEVETAVETVWATFGVKLGNFLSHHLVTLDTQSEPMLLPRRVSFA